MRVAAPGGVSLFPECEAIAQANFEVQPSVVKSRTRCGQRLVKKLRRVAMFVRRNVLKKLNQFAFIVGHFSTLKLIDLLPYEN